MKWTSLRSGTRRMTQVSGVRRVAAMMGSTAFLEPLICTSPRNVVPPYANTEWKRLSLFIPYSAVHTGGESVDGAVYGENHEAVALRTAAGPKK